MKLRAVRLSEVGHFGTGVALEGLSGGFDVLAGPNEMGKSTIFRAIEAALPCVLEQVATERVQRRFGCVERKHFDAAIAGFVHDHAA